MGHKYTAKNNILQRGARRSLGAAAVSLSRPPRPARPRPPPPAAPSAGRSAKTEVVYTALPFRTYNFAGRKFQPKQFNGLFENSNRVRVS